MADEAGVFERNMGLLKERYGEETFSLRANGRVTYSKNGRVFVNPTAALKWAEGAKFALEGVARENIGGRVREVYERITRENPTCELPSGEDKLGLEMLARVAEEMGVDLDQEAAAEGGARRRGAGTRRRAAAKGRSGRKLQRGGAFFKNLYALLKAYCNLGGAVAGQAITNSERELQAKTLRLQLLAQDDPKRRKAAEALTSYFKGGAIALGTTAVSWNLAAGSASWIYRLSVVMGNLLTTLTPSASGAASASATAAAAAGVMAVPALKFTSAAIATLYAWRAMKYLVLGLGKGAAKAKAAVNMAVSPAAVSVEAVQKYEYPGSASASGAAGAAAPAATMGERVTKIKVESQDILLKYLSAILFDDPEALPRLRKAQHDADKERTAEQLAEIVRQGLEGVRSSAATAASAASAAAKMNAAKQGAKTREQQLETAYAFMGKNTVPKSALEAAKYPIVKPGPGMPPASASSAGNAAPVTGLASLKAPPEATAPKYMSKREGKREGIVGLGPANLEAARAKRARVGEEEAAAAPAAALQPVQEAEEGYNSEGGRRKRPTRKAKRRTGRKQKKSTRRH